MKDKIPFVNFGGAGPVLHFAHANGFAPGCYKQLLTQFTERYKVVAMCLRPLWPDSNPQEFNNWQIMSEDFFNFLQQQDYKPVIAVGHSLGAVVTMKAAIRYPDLFKALILIEPVFMPPQILSMLQNNPQAARSTPLYQKTIKRRNRWPDRQSAFEHFRSKAIFNKWTDQSLWDYIRYGFHDTGDGQVALTYKREWEAQIYAHFPLSVWQEIPQITQPTLAIRGIGSDTLFPQAWQLWQDLQAQGTFVEIPDAGHMVPMERTHIVADQIKKFLDTVEE